MKERERELSLTNGCMSARVRSVMRPKPEASNVILVSHMAAGALALGSSAAFPGALAGTWRATGIADT